MGFTALDGLAMGTRPGQLDPGVVLYLIAEKGMSAAQVQNFLYHDCGLKGLSGISNDMRELERAATRGRPLRSTISSTGSASTPACWRRHWQGLDAFVFTAGIGENSATIRARIAEKLAWLGVTLDPAENARHAAKYRAPTAASPFTSSPPTKN